MVSHRKWKRYDELCLKAVQFHTKIVDVQVEVEVVVTSFYATSAYGCWHDFSLQTNFILLG